MLRPLFCWPPETLSAPLLFEEGWCEKYLNLGDSCTDVSKIWLGGATGRLLPEGLDRNEVEFGWADLRSFIFAVFRMSYKVHAGVCGRKTQKRTLSPTYTYAHFVRLSAKQQRASQIHPPKLTNISVKALLEAAAPLPHPAKFRKLCIGSDKLRYFSLRKRVANPILFWMFKIECRPKSI